MGARLPPAEKLALAVRKNFRDSYEIKKSEHEAELSRVLGVAWTIDINPLVVFPYCEESQRSRLGDIINSYAEGAINQLRYNIEKHDEELRSEINSIAHAHSLTLDVDEKGRFSYCGCDVVDGMLEMQFNAKNLWSNASDVLSKSVLFPALNRAAPAPGGQATLNFLARHSITNDYNPKIEAQREKLASMLQCESIKFVPNFEDVFAKLSAAGKHVDEKEWAERLGKYVLSYFEGLVRQMKYLKFDDDEMLREGFLEAVDKNEIAFRVIDKLAKANYCEVVIEEGVLYIQTIPSKYGVNISDAAEKLIDQL